MIFGSLLFMPAILWANSYIKQTVPAWMEENQIPGVAVQIYDHGKPESYYFGVANKEINSPITSDTIFEVGSVTKIMTSLLLVQQLQNKHLVLTDKLNQLLPDITKGNSLMEVTLENLATHTSGVPFRLPENVTIRSQLVKYFKNWKPTAPIGTQWGYSNLGFGLLGDALEVSTHKNLNQLYRNDLLLPLSMKPIGITVPQQWRKDYAQGYSKDDEPLPSSKLTLSAAGGAMKMTAVDTLKLLQVSLSLSNNTDINQAMQLTQTPFVQVGKWQQGLGWEIHCDPLQHKKQLLHPPPDKILGPLPAQQLPAAKRIYDGTCLMDKTGATYSFRSYIVVISQTKTGVVILTNKYIPDGEIVTLGREILFNLLSA